MVHTGGVTQKLPDFPFLSGNMLALNNIFLISLLTTLQVVVTLYAVLFTDHIC